VRGLRNPHVCVCMYMYQRQFSYYIVISHYLDEVLQKVMSIPKVHSFQFIICVEPAICTSRAQPQPQAQVHAVGLQNFRHFRCFMQQHTA
jgi:hypothetical protein